MMRLIPFWGCMMPLKYPQMELAIRKTLPNLGIELVDVDGFTCCPDPIYFKARNKIKWLTVAARNLAVAEETGIDIITMCSGCISTLKEAQYLLAEDPDLMAQINRRLKRINREYKGKVKVKHAVVMMRDDLGIEAIEKSVKRPLEDIKVAIHYGCHLLKPSQIMRVDDADYPSILDDFVTAIGAIPLDHDEKLLCCGKGCMDDELPLEMTESIFASIEASGADCMGLICPTCFSSFDMGQIMIARQKGKTYNIPVIYIFQLLGLAQGLSAEDIGLHTHRVKADKVLEKIV
ncbi:MAG: CoB--CoM heterodisulfide reductase subunit B [candidate division WOR-3 bacterium]|nr:MAG: CoB--CoM heterodisulfide reductase subunit B [candidate division WOR-3 bacterium]